MGAGLLYSVFISETADLSSFDLIQRGNFVFTALRGIGTARPEATASRKLIQTWHNAVDHIELLLGFSHPGQSLQQSLGIGVQRISNRDLTSLYSITIPAYITST